MRRAFDELSVGSAAGRGDDTPRRLAPALRGQGSDSDQPRPAQQPLCLSIKLMAPATYIEHAKAVGQLPRQWIPHWHSQAGVDSPPSSLTYYCFEFPLELPANATLAALRAGLYESVGRIISAPESRVRTVQDSSGLRYTFNPDCEPVSVDYNFCVRSCPEVLLIDDVLRFHNPTLAERGIRTGDTLSCSCICLPPTSSPPPFHPPAPPLPSPPPPLPPFPSPPPLGQLRPSPLRPALQCLAPPYPALR
eukprot:tig00020563_g11265.t1